ncbi:hypothetical protein GUJ93_ZPchr0002g24735 [Zizania palustris]|uniref:Caffeoyl-CoA O-methyltransferase n=1 Tax=Zizania palustris TaxID=103762 RepID=A0A8J5VES3_ZIZPA|nr:hypothetical protein GUJ93_ZPchr0002g24735 [Zizania palustris]
MASAGGGNNGGDVLPDIHRAGDSKTLLKSNALYQYILDTTVLPQEPPCLRELRHLTDKHELALMASPADEMQLLGMLVKMIGAKNAIEVGVFTGHSLLATALALPDDGKVVAIDRDRRCYDGVGRAAVAKAGVAHKVDFREGVALDVLDQLLAADGSEGKFDFAFVDADKANYVNYHERLLRLVRVGGLVVYDNTLWGGAVAMPPGAPMSAMDRSVSAAIKVLNAFVAADPRVEACQLPVADGVTICRRTV